MVRQVLSRCAVVARCPEARSDEPFRCSLCGSTEPKAGCPQCELRQPSLFSPPLPEPTADELALGDKHREEALSAAIARRNRADKVERLKALARPIKIGLVGCSKTKRRDPAPARGLYISDLFRAAIAYGELACDEVYIMSAFHGLVELDQVIVPYEQKLMDLPKRSRMAWGERVAAALLLRLPRLRVQLVFFAGVDYVTPVQAAALRYGWISENPLRTMAIGRRRAWLVGETARLMQSSARHSSRLTRAAKRR